MSEAPEDRRQRLLTRLGTEAVTRVPLPDTIFLTDRSHQAEDDPIEVGAAGKKGQHVGGRRVDEPRSAWLSTRCTPAFKQAVIAAAAAAGLTYVDYIHMRLSDDRYEPRRHKVAPSGNIDVLRRILAQMGKQGGNLNQLAYRLNSCDARDLHDEVLAMRTEHKAALATHREVCAAILTALGV